jgi:omega-hydroxy-beta-dihydromenaquinone-9 sulfotransferase
VFPRHAAFYDRYWTFEAATDDEVARWKSSITRFLAKLISDTGRPLVLKSPPHTGRIRLLLELFPDARFVHIRRDPYTVFRSTRHMYATTMRFWQLQVSSSHDFDDRILRIYRAMYDAYFDQRDLIPEGRSCEIRYEDLEADPIGQVGDIYRALGLADFESVRPRLQGYIDSIGGYRKNRHPELPEGQRRRISTEWRRSFEAWGYAAR